MEERFPGCDWHNLEYHRLGNSIALEILWEGTHTGDLQMPSGAITATGKNLSVQGTWVMEIDGDQVSASRHYFDMLTLLQQIGAAPGAG